MIKYNIGLNNYLRAVVDAEALALPFTQRMYYGYERYLRDLVAGRLSLFVDSVNIREGTCEVVTTCGIRKRQPIEVLKMLPDFRRGYGALLTVLRPINKDLLKKHWAMDNTLINAVVTGRINLPEIDLVSVA